MTIRSTFGFSQTERTLAANLETGVRWIDTVGSSKFTFDPKPHGILILSQIPNSYGEFQTLVDQQYKLGYMRAIEAVRIKPHLKNVRTHLRSPVDQIQVIQ